MSIDKLNDTNWRRWEEKVMALMNRKLVGHYLNWDGITYDNDHTDIGDAKARSYIILNIEDSQFKYIRGTVKTKDTYLALRTWHMSKTQTSKLKLENDYANLTWNDNEQSLEDFIDHYSEIVAKGESVDNPKKN